LGARLVAGGVEGAPALEQIAHARRGAGGGQLRLDLVEQPVCLREVAAQAEGAGDLRLHSRALVACA